MSQQGLEVAEPIRVGISACLVGRPVRYDGGHKRQPYLIDTLGDYLQWVPVCPEVELGLGVPREPIQLVADGERLRLRTVRTGIDLTARMRSFARRRVRALADEDLCGFVLKSRSPSCGMERVAIHSARGTPRRAGRGLFAQALLDRCPHLPVEEEGRLSDPRLRENWIERVFAYHALAALWKGRWTANQLADFHARYRFVLLAHSDREYRHLSRLVSEAASLPRAELRRRYEAGFMATLKKRATPRKNAKVLKHMLRFFSGQLSAAALRELLDRIEAYRTGRVPLVVPWTLVRHYVRVLDVAPLKDQAYLDPHPKELLLRNHA